VNKAGSRFRFLVVAFYTKDTPYQEEAKELAKTCEEHGLTLVTKGYETRGSWVQNAGIKPEFLLAMMKEHKCDLLYVDADARIRQSVDLSFVEHDVAVHYRNEKELLSGTIFLRHTDAVMHLLREWVCMQQASPGDWDQKTLQDVIEKVGIPVHNLPPQYTQIFDKMAHHGDPIIEHMQASRRYRRSINMRPKIPAKIGKSRLRVHGDGSVSIVRRDRVAERFLDEKMNRCKGERRWFPKFIAGSSKLTSLQPIFVGKRCYIVGKGPSLDKLKKRDFPDTKAPIIALNESVLEVEKLDIPNPIFGLQQDSKLRDTCYPETAGIFVSQKAVPFYEGKDRVYAFSSLTYGLSINSLSVLAAMAIARSFGVQGFYFICFDAATSGGKTLDYAKSVPYDATWGGDPKRFKTHKARMMHAARGLVVGWATPR